MLETTVIDLSTKRGKRLLVLPVSIAIHLALIAGAVFASVWRVHLPENVPAQISSYQAAMAVPLPPPAPAQKRRASQPMQRQPEIDPQQQVTPTLIPEELPRIAEPGTGDGSANGSPDGLPGGEPGGHSDGIPGGVTTEPGPVIHRVGEHVKQPKILFRVDPKYPEHARRIRLEGWVAIECIVDKAGRTQNLRIVESSHPIFEAAAIEALRAWRFSAGTLNGNPVDTVFVLRVNFRLD